MLCQLLLREKSNMATIREVNVITVMDADNRLPQVSIQNIELKYLSY